MERFIGIFQHKQELRNNGKILTINNYKQSHILNWGFSWLVGQILVLTATWTFKSDYFRTAYLFKNLWCFLCS